MPSALALSTSPRCPVQLAFTIERPRPDEELIDDRPQPLGLFECAADQIEQLRCEKLLLRRRLELAAENRERRAQLVRDVGRKTIDVLKGVFETLHHSVERDSQSLE